MAANTSTTTTNGSTVTFTVTYYVTYEDQGLTAKERARRKRSREWLAKVKERHDKWLQEELARIRKWSEDNAWRPRVSNYDDPKNRSHPHELKYWTLTASDDPDQIEPLWRTIYRRYMRGWVGLTVGSPSQYERDAINAFIKTLKKRDVLVDRGGDWLEWDDRCGIIGEFTALQLGIWFRNLDDHNRFVELLESFERRSQMFKLGDAAEVDAIQHLLEGENYLLSVGSDAAILSMVPGNNAVLAKMFVG